MYTVSLVGVVMACKGPFFSHNPKIVHLKQSLQQRRKANTAEGVESFLTLGSEVNETSKLFAVHFIRYFKNLKSEMEPDPHPLPKSLRIRKNFDNCGRPLILSLVLGCGTCA